MPGEPWYARRFDSTYLEVYAHRNVEEARRATESLLVPLGLPGKRVLDLACGAGRYSAALAERGARVVGLDLSTALLHAAGAELGEREGLLGLVRGDMLRLPFRPGSFDLVISMFTSFGYFATADEDRGMLREIRRALRPGGDLVLDFLNAARLLQHLEPESVRRVGRFEVRERRALDAARTRVVKHIELRSGEERHEYQEEVRLWSRAELVAALEGAGLHVVTTWGDYAGGPFEEPSSERLLLWARAAPPRPALEAACRS
jgi:SAM-dependent methyltransferase